MVARKIMDVSPERNFCILIANASNYVINLGKHQRVAITCLPFLEILHNKNDEPSSYSLWQPLPDSANVVQCKPAPDRPRHMNQHETVQKNDDNPLNNNWREEVTPVKRYEKY